MVMKTQDKSKETRTEVVEIPVISEVAEVTRELEEQKAEEAAAIEQEKFVKVVVEEKAEKPKARPVSNTGRVIKNQSGQSVLPGHGIKPSWMV